MPIGNPKIPPRTREIVMSDQRVLVAFASRSGSTAGIAQAIAAALRGAGLAVDSSPAGDVTDVNPYAAVVLGSGVFLPRRQSDGGGFLLRHAPTLATRAVWLYSAGPIGGGHGGDGAESAGSGDGNVYEVGRAIGARGAAVFGTPVPTLADDSLAELTPVDLARVRSWAAEIAAQLSATGMSGGRPPETSLARADRPRGCSRPAPAR
jgi:menaquinone-dependent protoporphyrinogen oxidase